VLLFIFIGFILLDVTAYVAYRIADKIENDFPYVINDEAIYRYKKVYAMTLAINRFKISANSFIDGLLLPKNVDGGSGATAIRLIDYSCSLDASFRSSASRFFWARFSLRSLMKKAMLHPQIPIRNPTVKPKHT